MARLLPLFPLNLVVFPGEKLNLHIFEPRYRQLIHDCLRDDLPFGIPFFQESLHEVGTEVRLLSIEKAYPNGEMDITTQGVRVFRIQQFLREAPGKLYAAARVEYIPDDDAQPDPALHQRLAGYVTQLYQVLGLPHLRQQLPAQFRSFELGHHIGFSPEQEYTLLTATSEQERQELMVEHLERMLPALQQAERLKERAHLNGHFKNLTPPHF